MSGRPLLAVRLDNAGDMLVTGPAIRALATAGDVTVLCGPAGEAAARLLPGVADVVVWDCPWVTSPASAFDPAGIDAIRAEIAGRRFAAAVVFTSWHQSPLPTALLLRLAGVARIAAISEDYPGALLDVRHRVDDDIPEPERALSLATAAGYALPDGDDGRLAVRRPLPSLPAELAASAEDTAGYVVVHPGASVPARAASPERNAAYVEALAASGRPVVVTGGAAETGLCAQVAGEAAIDLSGRLDLAELAAVLDAAAAVVVGNTGPAHLAAAVGTPVVSLFAPVIPAVRWLPYRVPTVVLGDQRAACRGTRATVCPVPGHPCLDVPAAAVVAAVDRLAPVLSLAGTP
jgi:ADP-heptose:LPS heptosyltransferase